MDHELTSADLVWNRAAMEEGGKSPAVGDRALAALLYAHGLVMNGGVLHACELLTDRELQDASSGFKFFGLHEVAELLVTTKAACAGGAEVDESEPTEAYLGDIPDDSSLVRRFESRFKSNPDDFSPL